MISYKTNLSVLECERKLNDAIKSFPKKQKERNKLDCFRGNAKKGKISILYSIPKKYPQHKIKGNLALVGKMYCEKNITCLQVKFISPVLIKSFYIPYFIIIFLILALYGLLENIVVLNLYKELAFFVLAYILLIFLTRTAPQIRLNKSLKFIETTLHLIKM